MLRRLIQIPLRSVAVIAAVCVASCVSISCDDPKPKPIARPTYPDLGEKKVPAFLEGTIYQYTEIRDASPFRVAGFGLVVNADPIPNASIEPGSQRYPTAVRAYMLRAMLKHKVGSINEPGWEKISPEQMLRDPRNSIVRVIGLIPPGARAGRSMDIQVQALYGSVTKSLARGWLYQTDLAPRGGDTRAPGVAINILAKAQGQVFVNPALALNTDPTKSAGERASLLEGVILDGGYIAQDRPLVIQLRTPQLSLARQIEWRIDEAFQDPKTAAAQDEGLVNVYVPEKFGGDWQHFAGVLRYLFLNTNPAFPALKAQQLVTEALKPNAPLEDISYCWEGLGAVVIPYITPLMSSDNPDLAYAAARAAAYVGDRGAQDVLVAMAQTPKHKFQLNAVQVLGNLPSSLEVNHKIRELLNSPETLVRIEAYKMLAKNHDSSIFTRVIATGNEKFVLDLVPSTGPPLVYATRAGQPRIVVMGPKTSLELPLIFSALDNRLTIATSEHDKNLVTIYYRGTEFPQPITVLSRPDLAEVIARLGGEGPIEDEKLDFGYGDVVAMLQSLADSRKLVAMYDGKMVNANFVLQELQRIPDDIRSAPLLPGQVKQEPSGATSSAGN
ncbi:hypothetical protein BH10PLA1_BH10PLA1_14020 [soil metagenome]